MKDLIPAEIIERKIYLIRGQKVMLDNDLAGLYDVEVKQLKRQVRRNEVRFPPDFMFTLTKTEYVALRRHFGTLKRGGYAKYLPYVFTEQGVAMLSSVLNSKRSISVNIAIMRAFVRLRHVLATHKDIAEKLETMERRIAKNEMDVQSVAKVIRDMLQPKQKRHGAKIGFFPEKAR